MADKKKKDIVSSLINKAVKAGGASSDKKSASKESAAKKTAPIKGTAAKKAENVKSPSKTEQSGNTAAKQVKSKEEQKKDIMSLGAAVAVAGVAASKAVSAKTKGKNKKPINALIVVLCLILFACGVMYYFDIGPLDFVLEGFEFKYYTYEVGDFGEGGIPAHLEGELKIHFIDVGQGDCIFIQFPDGKTMLIDGGENRTAVAQGIVNYLLALYEQKVTIDYLMLTHCDSDHCGSIDEVIKSPQIDVLNVYQPRVYSKYENDLLKEYVAQNGMNNAQGNWENVPTISTGVYASFAEAVYLEKQELGDDFGEIIYNFEGLEIHGDGWSIYMYNPAEEMYDSLSTAKAKNNISPVMVLCYGDNRILLTGDADEKAEQNFVANLSELSFSDSFSWDGDCDILKVGHHGGAESTLAAFLQTVQPEYAVISAGENNKYDHPRQVTLDRLAQYAQQNIFITFMYGSIVLTVDGGGFSWDNSGEEELPAVAALFTVGTEFICYNLLYTGLINPLKAK